jgi:hypothetical protein
MLEFGPTYELTRSTITSRLNSAGTELEDNGHPVLLIGMRFTLFDWNEWEPYSTPLKEIGENCHFYAIRLERAFCGSDEYLVLADRLEQGCRRV